MALSLKKTFKKEDSDAESQVQQDATSDKDVEANQDEPEKKGKHGEDFCCGSCS